MISIFMWHNEPIDDDQKTIFMHWLQLTPIMFWGLFLLTMINLNKVMDKKLYPLFQGNVITYPCPNCS